MQNHFRDEMLWSPKNPKLVSKLREPDWIGWAYCALFILDVRFRRIFELIDWGENGGLHITLNQCRLGSLWTKNTEDLVIKHDF